MHPLREKMAELAATGLSEAETRGFLKGAEYAYGICDYKVAEMRSEVQAARELLTHERGHKESLTIALAVAEAEMESYKKHLRLYRRIFAYYLKPSALTRLKNRFVRRVIDRLEWIYAAHG